MPPLSFGQLSFQIPVTPSLLFALFALLVATWLICTIIFRYHWKNYTVSWLEVVSMNLIYFIGSGILLAGMGLFALLYSL